MTTSRLRVALIEDNEDLREELLFFLRHRGYGAWGVRSAEAFWKQLHRDPADVVLVDLGLPGEDGFSVVEYLNRMGGYGLVILTAHGGERQRLRGLNLGADLFLVKPVNFARLAESLEALGRRGREAEHGQASAPALETTGTGAWRLDPGLSRLFDPEGASLVLSCQERALLEILLRSANQVLSKEALHDLLFEHACSRELHRIDVILSRLRRKARDQGMSLPIRAVFGRGIAFVGAVRESV